MISLRCVEENTSIFSKVYPSGTVPSPRSAAINQKRRLSARQRRKPLHWDLHALCDLQRGVPRMELRRSGEEYSRGGIRRHRDCAVHSGRNSFGNFTGATTGISRNSGFRRIEVRRAALADGFTQGAARDHARRCITGAELAPYSRADRFVRRPGTGRCDGIWIAATTLHRRRLDGRGRDRALCRRSRIRRRSCA